MAPAHPPVMPSDDPPLPEAGKFTLVQLELADEDLTVVFTHRRRQPPKASADFKKKEAIALTYLDMKQKDIEHHFGAAGEISADDQIEYTQKKIGFAEDQVARMFEDAGFGKVRIVPLVPDAHAKGPGLFVATGEKGE